MKYEEHMENYIINTFVHIFLNADILPQLLEFLKNKQNIQDLYTPLHFLLWNPESQPLSRMCVLSIHAFVILLHVAFNALINIMWFWD